MVYRNKWPKDWYMHWFNYWIEMEAKRCGPCTARRLLSLRSRSLCSESTWPRGALFVAALGAMSKVYIVRDLIEESCLCKVFPVREGWSVSDWEAGNSGEILMPDFAKIFGLTVADVDANRAKAAADMLLG